MKYMKKNVVFEAKIYEKGMEDGFTDINDGDEVVKDIPFLEANQGIYLISEGDYIVSLNGNRYPVSPEIFEEEFEETEKSLCKIMRINPDILMANRKSC